MKKHISQMSRKEKKYLTQRFLSVPQGRWKWNQYSKRRKRDRGCDNTLYRSLWTDGFDLIEYHYEESKGHHRILMRSQCCDSQDNQLCVVFNLTTYEITTVYTNKRWNKHNNLVLSEYGMTRDILEHLKATS